MQNSVIKKFLEEELGMIEIQGGFLIKGIRIPIPTFYISKLPITKELWRAVMNDDKKRDRVEWYEYVQFARKLTYLTRLNFFIPSDDYLDYAYEKNKDLKDSIFKTWEFLPIGLWNLTTYFPYPVDKHIGANLTCSMGNGHDEIRFIIATKDNPNNYSYSKEDEEKIQNILNRLSEIRNLQNSNTEKEIVLQKDTDSTIAFPNDAWEVTWEEDTCYFNADKYLEAQDRWDTYQKALREVKEGRKRGHWIWFIFPQMFGLGTSELARYYGIYGRDEAKEYIKHPILRERLVEITEAVYNNENTVYEIFGNDAIKVRSCMLLFASVCDIPIFKQMIYKYGWK